MEYYLGNIENNILYSLVTLLGSRYKILGFSNDEYVTRARENLMQTATKYTRNESEFISTKSENCNISNINDSENNVSLWSFFNTEVSNVNRNLSSSFATRIQL